jgi:diguanylate cyclase (GGDEF)-like protein
MMADVGTDVGRAGQRIQRKVLVALVLSSVLPMLVLLAVVLPTPDPGGTLKIGVLQLLTLLTIVGMLVGDWVLWDLGRTVARLGAMMGGDSTASHRQDEVGTLMISFNKMLVTIEQQATEATEINTFASRLDAAYKEMEATNAQLTDTSFKDDITGLYNRRFLLLRPEEKIERWRRLGVPCSLALLDFGRRRLAASYAEQDADLAALAQIFIRSAPSPTSVMARYDGRRFALLLTQTSQPGTVRFVERVRNAVAAEHLEEERAQGRHRVAA